jgi:hypothetical protein
VLLLSLYPYPSPFCFLPLVVVVVVVVLVVVLVDRLLTMADLVSNILIIKITINVSLFFRYDGNSRRLVFHKKRETATMGRCCCCCGRLSLSLDLDLDLP